MTTPPAPPTSEATGPPARHPGRAVGRILLAGLLQAAAVKVGQAFLFPLLLLLPLGVGAVPGLHVGRYTWLALTCALGALVLGRVFPRHAGWRGGAAFLWLAGLDAWQAEANPWSSIFVWQLEYAPLLFLYLLSGFGPAFFAGAVGAWATGDWRGFLREEFEEFYESVGLRPEDDEERPAED